MLEKLFGWERCGDAWLKFERFENPDGYCVMDCKPGSRNCVIPESYKGLDVIYIFEGAFSRCKSLESITIPKTITRIGDDAFDIDKPSLKNVYITDVRAWCKIEFGNVKSNPLLRAKKLYVDGVEAKRLEIPKGVRTIPRNAFVGVESVEELIIGEDTRIIQTGAFSWCKNLRRITLPNTLEVIGNNAFYHCPKIECLDIPDSVKEIGEYAFFDSFAEAAVYIGGGLKVMHSSAFYGGNNHINALRFDSEEMWARLNLEKSYPVCSNTEVYFGEERIEEFVFPEGITEIKGGALRFFGKLLRVYIPASVKKVGKEAFRECEVAAWYYGGNAEQWARLKKNDTYNELPDEPTEYEVSVEMKAVAEGDKLSATLDVPIGAGNRAVFGDADVRLEEIDGGWKIVQAKKGATRLSIPPFCDGRPVLEIAESVFEGFKDLVSVRLSDTVKKLGRRAFSGCKLLEEVVLSEGLIEIGVAAFSECPRLSFVHIPEGVRVIETNAFASTGVSSFELPASVTKLGTQLIHHCTNVTSLTVREGNERYYAERNCIISAENSTLIIGCGESVIPKDGSVKAIGNSAFTWMPMRTLDLPDGLERIEAYAFTCSDLTEIEIPDTVREVSMAAFSNCKMLERVILSSGMSVINQNTFVGCTALWEIYIPSSVKKIGEMAFSECKSLRAVRFGGTKEEFNRITIEKGNDFLKRAEIIFNA